jgi:hypothetical protein
VRHDGYWLSGIETAGWTFLYAFCSKSHEDCPNNALSRPDKARRLMIDHDHHEPRIKSRSSFDLT